MMHARQIEYNIIKNFAAFCQHFIYLFIYLSIYLLSN